jgi:hypothetical protein
MGAKELLEQATPLPWRASETTIWSENRPDDPTDWSGDAVAYTAQDKELEDGTYATAALIVYAVNRLPDYEAAVDALEKIKSEEGKVCDQYEMCEHRACQSSYGAWAIADAALARLRGTE